MGWELFTFSHLFFSVSRIRSTPHKMKHFLFIIMVHICFTYADNSGQKFSDGNPLFETGKCNGLWRPEPLPGKCFGLNPVPNQYGVVANLRDCRSLCCNLGENCISWQFQTSTSTCRIGGVIRLGLEKTGTADWCDPLPPSTWNGNRLISKQADGVCVWGEELKSQCFGLGDERKSVQGSRYDAAGCRAACCSAASVGGSGVTAGCAMWQEAEGRGCFFSETATTQCPKMKGERFIGGRKCVPKFCGGMEDLLLGQFNTSLTLRASARRRRKKSSKAVAVK